MHASKLAGFMEETLSPVSRILSKLGSGILLLMVFLTVADVAGRKLFNMPVKGAYELGEMLLVLVVFFNMPNTEMRDGNVSIEILFLRFGHKTRKIVLALMYILFLIVAILMAWQLFVLAKDEMTDGFTTTILNIPKAPVIFLASLSCALLCFVVLARLFLIVFGGKK